MLLVEEGAVERVDGGVAQELEAVEYLHGAAPLDPDDAPVHPRGIGRRRGGRIGAAVAAGAVGGGRRVELGLDAGVVIGDVEDHQRVELEREAAAGRRH